MGLSGKDLGAEGKAIAEVLEALSRLSASSQKRVLDTVNTLTSAIGADAEDTGNFEPRPAEQAETVIEMPDYDPVTAWVLGPAEHKKTEVDRLMARFPDPPLEPISVSDVSDDFAEFAKAAAAICIADDESRDP